MFVNGSQTILKELNQYFNILKPSPSFVSTIYYMELLDEHPDSADTMRHLSEHLLVNASSDSQDGCIVLVGDGKTYEHLMQVKLTYGSEMTKLFIFPGDWHVLKNYQPVLIKVYYNAGLKELAQTAGFRGETLKSLEKCSNFKRTHRFLLQVWQAMYRSMIHNFLQENSQLLTIAATFVHNTDTISSVQLLEAIRVSTSHTDFIVFLKTMSTRDSTWKFWSQFVLTDCPAYVGLYLAIRNQNWHLLVSSLKLMAPLFAAFDRTTYQNLIPKHLADVQSFPDKIIHSFESGGFVVNVTGEPGHSIALDEAHEMCINKDMKGAIARPNKTYLQKISLFLRYRIRAHKNLIHELFPETRPSTKHNACTILDNSSEVKKREENIVQMFTQILDSECFSTVTPSDRGLFNPFSGIHATPEQAHDMLSFREIGDKEFLHYVEHRILHQPSVKHAPVRKHRLLTMATPNPSKKRVSHKEKEYKQVTICLRRRLAWCNRTGQAYNPAVEQYSIFPRALTDASGNPNKGSKATWTEKVNRRYQEGQYPIVSNSIPPQWIPQIVIIDGMFTINCSPLRHTSKISDYANLILNRFVQPHYQAGVNKVHLVFDTPCNKEFSPKSNERNRRDKLTEVSHEHITFLPTSKLPAKWRAYIECRQCKHSIIEALGTSFLTIVRFSLPEDKVLVIAGCFTDSSVDTAWIITGGAIVPRQETQYTTTAEEADMRVWKHALECGASRILIYSPDTDVYNIGITLSQYSPLDCIVQLNQPHSREQKYLNLANLTHALMHDTDLASLPRTSVLHIFQMLFICTGCDYISYFSGIGKVGFLNAFFQHACFITGEELEGLLSQTGQSDQTKGFLAFLRLVGTAYFKKHLSAFITIHSAETPNHLFYSTQPTLSQEKRHIEWYNTIRSTVANRILNEEDRAPSHTALWRHWLRSCWIKQMWQHSRNTDPYGALPPPEQCGWSKDADAKYAIVWDAPDVQSEVEDNIKFLTKGCSCKKGCKTKQCGCRRKSRMCGPGCECIACTNIHTEALQQTTVGSGSETSDSDSDSDRTSDNSYSDSDNVQTELVFMDLDSEDIIILPDIV